MKIFPEAEAVGKNPTSLSASEITQVKSAVAAAGAAMQRWRLKTLRPEAAVKAAAGQCLSRDYCCPSPASLTP